jgi:16S rRNA (guanine(966)-N(2))-methyltransferase RsmD
MPGIRVIGGSAKGRKLKMVPGTSTRPIGDRVKEALFNIIDPEIKGSSFLDLFAGTGSVGIEALSRGARSTHFIELDRKAVQTIRENLAHCGLDDRAVVSQRDTFAYLASHQPGQAYEIIFLAPPQYLGLWEKTLHALDERPEWLEPDGLLIIQIDPSEYQEQVLKTLKLYDQRKYGNTMLLFFEKPGE